MSAKQCRDDMTHYKAILLLISADDEYNDQYRMKKIKPEWRPLMPFFKEAQRAYADVRPDMRTFFIYANSKKASEAREDELIFEHIPENDNPGIVAKSLEAMGVVHERYSYDYIIRSNLSTFWDLNRLSDRLDKLPKEKCFAGHILNARDFGRERYIAGYDLIFSRDVIEKILPYKKEIMDLGTNNKVWCNLEDIAISRAVQQYADTPITSYPFRNDIMFMAMDDGFSESQFKAYIEEAHRSGLDHYRVKNMTNRLTDKEIMRHLLKDTYGKTIL